MTKIASANIQKGLGWGPLQAAAQRMIQRNVGIIGFQEIYDFRVKALRKMMARKGYGLAVAQDVPIAYDLKRYKLLGSNARRLPGGVIPGNSARFGNWVALKDRKTGQVSVLTNTHLSRRRTRREAQWHRQQINALEDLQRDLRERFGKDADYYITGDFNDGTLGPKHFGLKANRNGSPIDYIFSERRPKKETNMATASDHPTYIGMFKASKGDGKKKKDKGPLESSIHGGDKPPTKPHNQHDENLSAWDLFSNLLESWGVPVGSDIERIIKKAMIEGYTPDMIDLLIPDIQDTKSWKQRFPGWHDRVKNGYNQLSVEEYLNLENTYHRIMQEAGLPAGFYDDPSDFGNWIAQDVSPDEIQNRVGLAVDAAKKVDPTARNLMAQFYGLGTGDIASFFLDQDRALPVIQRQYEAANVAAWAKKAGFGVNSMSRYENLVDSGITAEQAASSYGTIRSLSDSVGDIASIYGDTYDQTDAEEDVFFGRSDKRRKIVSQEAGTFSGRSQGQTGSASRNAY